MNEDLDKFAARLATCLGKASIKASEASMGTYGYAAERHAVVGITLLAVSKAIAEEFGPKKGETL